MAIDGDRRAVDRLINGVVIPDPALIGTRS
jgi:hypothetical protein